MNAEQAVRLLRSDPKSEAVVRDSYLGPDIQSEAQRFAASAEFEEILNIVGRDQLAQAALLDLGSGIGIAAWAFARAGAKKIYAVEPDSSDEVGLGAIRRLCAGLPVSAIAAFGENIPLADASVDIVYARQVLHHTRDLPRVLCECARVLRAGGLFIASREHVADDTAQLQEFLQNHPLHHLTGGENAYRKDQYESAITQSLRLERSIGPWDSVINAFPAIRSDKELESFPRTLLKQKFGVLGAIVSQLPGIETIVWKHLNRPVPGRLYTFIAHKGAAGVR